MASGRRKVKSLNWKWSQEDESNFYAAGVGRQQMYKKRFAKWGMQKNSRRLATSTQTSTTTVSRNSTPSGDLALVLISPGFGNEDSLMLMFLSSVRIWSVSFYESVQSSDEGSAPMRQSSPVQSQEMNFTFKLVIDMLNRRQGGWAGRVARKAFLLVEEMLTLEGPALVWNMLEIMHYMVMSHQLQLFRLLLAHLVAMVDGRMSTNHPLPVMLKALGVFVASLPDVTSNSSKSLPTSSSSPRSVDGNEEKTAAESWLFSGAFLSMVCRAWTLNAEILFDNFDHRLFQLYIRIHWDSCSIEPPRAIFSAAKQWLAHVASQQISRTTAKANQTEGLIQIKPFEKDRALQRVFATPMNASPPRNYELLRVSSITVLRDHASSILSKGASSAGDATTLLRILAGLVTAKILEEWPAINGPADMGIDVTSKMSRGQAENLACAIRTSMDFKAERDGLEETLDTVRRLRSVVALREYASADTDPRVIREMWLLENALVAAGGHREALKVKQTAYRRLEDYVQDIPVNSA